MHGLEATAPQAPVEAQGAQDRPGPDRLILCDLQFFPFILIYILLLLESEADKVEEDGIVDRA